MLFRLWSNKNNLSNQRNFQANDDWNWYCTSFVTLPWLVEKRLVLPFNQSDHLIFPALIIRSALIVHWWFIPFLWLVVVYCCQSLVCPWSLKATMRLAGVGAFNILWRRYGSSMKKNLAIVTIKRVYLWIYQRWTLRIESKDWVLRKQTSTLQTRCISCTYSFLILFLCGSEHFEKLGWEMRVIFSRYE